MTITQTPTIERVAGTVMPVNTYLIHGPEALTVVDGQLTVSETLSPTRSGTLVVDGPSPTSLRSWTGAWSPC
jgi:hypothetical protein